MNDALLKVVDIKKYFEVDKKMFGKSSKYVHAVDGVSFSIHRKEVIGIVGESGCGKSTLAQVLMRIHRPTSGSIEFDGKTVEFSNKSEIFDYKRNVQMVFQDPYWSLNPRKMVRDIIAEPLRVHKIAKEENIDNAIGELLQMVGIEAGRMFSYPHEFSGGERQRIAIARSLSLKPKLLLLDEPTSSIDTLSQAEILNLLVRLKEELNLSYILISHDLSVIHYLSDIIIVMYLGKIVEMGKVSDIFEHMAHPYTKALISAIPVINDDGSVNDIEALEGNVPSAINVPRGCRFHERCKSCMDVCLEAEPVLKDMGNQHFAACHLIDS